MYSFTTEIRVLYGHVDQMGFVYYGRYLEYFEHSRNELLRSLGLPYTTIESAGIRLPVIEAHLNYKSAARYDDLIQVKSVIPEMPKARIRIEYEIYNGDQALLVTGYTVHGFLNDRNRPTRMPAKLNQVLEPHFTGSTRE